MDSHPINKEMWYLAYRWNDFVNSWEISPCFYPEKPLPKIKKPNIDSIRYKIGESVRVKKDGKEIIGVITGYMFFSYPYSYKSDSIYYDVRWVGAGHTAGYYREDEILKD